MEVKKIVEGMTAVEVAEVIDSNFKNQNKILEEDIAKQNNVIGVSEYKDFSEAEAVNVGDVRKYNGFLYECVEATTGAFDASKWKKSSFKAETEKRLSELDSEVSSIWGEFTMTVKTSNEYHQYIEIPIIIKEGEKVIVKSSGVTDPTTYRIYGNEKHTIDLGFKNVNEEKEFTPTVQITKLILYIVGYTQVETITISVQYDKSVTSLYKSKASVEQLKQINLTTGSLIGSYTFSSLNGSEYKDYIDLDIPVGSKISIKAEGSAEWSSAWVYYNGDVAKKRLVPKIIKGEIYNLEIKDENIYSVGFCIYTLLVPGDVSLSILYGDSLLKEKVEKLEEKTQTIGSNIFANKVGVCMGDSHAQRRSEWVNSVFSGIGAIYDEELTNVIAPQNVTGKGYEDYIDAMYAQAVRAVEQHQKGKQIDLILLDNVHYSTTDDPSKLVPFRPSDVVNIGNNAASSSQEQSWFSANFNSIISTITPKVGTILKSTWSGLVYELSFSGTPVEGKVFVLSIDGESYSTPIEEGDSVSSFVSRLGEWSFNEQKYLVQVDGSVLKLSYIGQESNPTVSISYNAGESGLTMTVHEKSELSTVYRYYNSLSTSGWNDINNWTLIWNFDKRCIIGAIEYLIENIPNVVIICVAIPNYRLSKGVFLTQGEFKNSKLYTDGRKRASYLLDVAQLYGLKSIDIEKLWNIALPNWFEFFNENDVHPKSNGYARIADVIISELS